jgi:hypothetical protein
LPIATRLYITRLYSLIGATQIAKLRIVRYLFLTFFAPQLYMPPKKGRKKAALDFYGLQWYNIFG